MTSLTDEELMLLEQLTYLEGLVQTQAGLPNTNGIQGLEPDGHTSIADLINRFFVPDSEGNLPIDILNNKAGDASFDTLCSEWAAIIRMVHDNPRLMALKLQATDGNTAFCWTDQDGEAVVIFKGTSGYEEWYDDVEGLNQADTKNQKEALDFIESLNFDDIAVIGHSKGGNKAKYVTILSDKVSRCISMDGQGFSDLFLEKYAAEIAEKSKYITSYSLNTDYVHILLFRLPGANEQNYIESNRPPERAGAGNHAPSSFYRYEQDENGNWRIVVENGSMIRLTDENSIMTYLHEFTNFVLNTMPLDKRNEIIPFIGHLLAMCMSNDGYVIEEVNGEKVKFTKENILEYIEIHQDEFSVVIANLMKYIETYNLTEEEIWDLFRAIGLETLMKKLYLGFNAAKKAFPPIGSIEDSIKDMLEFFYKNLTDGKKDFLIEQLIAWLDRWLKEQLGDGYKLDFVRLWEHIESEYSDIGKIPPHANQDMGIRTSKTYDYSVEAYNALMSVLRSIASQTYESLEGWEHSFGGEDWYSSLGISAFTGGIRLYGNHLSSVNAECRGKIEAVFEKVADIDTKKASALSVCRGLIAEQARKLGNLADRIG